MNSKNKGNTFERKISKMFSTRFKAKTGLENAFRRNADSGSFFGGSNQARKNTYDTDKATFGDIICPNNFRFSIECKHYKSPPSFVSLVKQENKQWDGWLEQAKQDSINSSKELLVIIKYNSVDEIVFLDKQHAGITELFCYKGYSAYRLSDFLTLDDSIFFD